MLGLTAILLLVAADFANALVPHQAGSSRSCMGWCPWIPPSSSTVGAAVNTKSGTIIGHAAEGYPLVSEYLGIPFAKPPVGNLRFASPEPYTGTTTITANTQPSSCPQAPATVNSSLPQNWQNLDGRKASFANHTSEDCLYLNVWNKASSTNTPKAVMIWLYGGGFHSGGISDDSESGALFVNEQDIIMVSANYRLNIFGFSGAPNVPANIGLLDQRLAVEWVRNNIAAFGGDPNKIVLFGHSAGGASTDLYNYAWTNDPIISGSIPMSGTASSFGNRLPNTTEAGWSYASSLLGCGNLTASNANDVLTCMRSKPAKDVFQAGINASRVVTQSLSGANRVYAGITGIFGPTVDNKTVFQNYTARGQSGQYIKVPMLAGSNNDEGCYFAEEGKVPVADAQALTEVVFTCPTETEVHQHSQQVNSTWKYFYSGKLFIYYTTLLILLIHVFQVHIPTFMPLHVLVNLGTDKKCTFFLVRQHQLVAFLPLNKSSTWVLTCGKHGLPLPTIPSTVSLQNWDGLCTTRIRVVL